MAAIYQMIYPVYFLEWKCMNFEQDFIEGPISNIPALVEIMAWHHPGDKPLSKPLMVS